MPRLHPISESPAKEGDIKFYPDLTDMDFHDPSPPNSPMVTRTAYPNYRTRLSFHGGTEVLAPHTWTNTRSPATGVIPMNALHRADRRFSVDKVDGNSQLWEGQKHAFPVVAGNVWRKLDCRLLPVASMFVFLSFLDRANIANARVAGLQTDLNITDYQYIIALTATYVPFALIEIPSTLLQKHVGANFLLPTMVILWGTTCALQGIVNTFPGLIICRVFIGVFEGGMLPGMALYLSSFYPRQRLQSRISAFFAAASLAGAFSGLLANVIVKMEGLGGRTPSQWIFILEGIFTVVFGCLSFFLLPRNVAEAKFLTPDEKTVVFTTLKADMVISEDDKFLWREVGVALSQPHVWFMIIAGFCSGAMLLGLASFTTPVVDALGYQRNFAQLMSVPPFALSFVLSILSSWISDKYRCRGLTTIFFASLSVIGFTIFLVESPSGIKYMSLFFIIPGTYCTVPPMAAWVSNNSAPHYRRATALALYTTSMGAGAILSIWLFGTISSAPEYKTAIIVLLGFSGAIFLCAGLNLGYLMIQNRRKASARGFARREAEPRGLGDRSAFFKYNL